MSEGNPTPSSRQVVLLREGPPKRRGAWVDAASGILGVLLLIGAGVLGEVLPEEDFIPNQWQITYGLDPNGTKVLFLDPTTEIVGQSYRGYLAPSEEITLPIIIPQDNTVRVTLEVYIPEDDVPSSLRDRFRFELEDPNGNPVGDILTADTGSTTLPNYDLENPPPTSGSWYLTPGKAASESWTLNTAPKDELLSGSDGKQITLQDALSFAITERTIPTKGLEYTLIIKLIEVGDCPNATPPSPATTQRFQDCQRNSEDGEDPGNPFTIQAFTAFNYDIASPDA